MTNESMTVEERQRRRKQLSDQSVKLAVAGQWEEAAKLNTDALESFRGRYIPRCLPSLTSKPDEIRIDLDLEPWDQ